MNNKIESSVVRVVLSLGVFGLGSLGLSGCTMNLPPTNEPIPTADPILLPDKTTTGNGSNSSATKTKTKTKTNTNDSAKSTEVAPPATTATSTVNNQAGANENTVNSPAKPSRQGQTFYVVKPKDTVFEVMRQTGVHWKEIIRLNSLKAPKYTIFPGQSLRIR